ncbi:transmembrane protein 265-like [Colossoma macropomum]|uniref:transmembrane protein 265-like n=1 Tax=Colossoma macropomum TaxID=42526 RepID=UPI0018655DAA|nr:transmembrane protein 265-like [Colossoma macropomum]XP_036445696.1 transmembrane protein 265-like [Colossoma macropomum]
MSTKLNHSQDVECGLMASSGGQHRDYRKLAIGSIICGLSCLGIMSLIYSVKTRAMNKGKLNIPEADRAKKGKEYSKKARNYGIFAIVAWVALLILIPLLTGLVSYLLTLIN